MSSETNTPDSKMSSDSGVGSNAPTPSSEPPQESDGGFSKKQLEQLTALFVPIESMLNTLNRRMITLENRTGYLVEEKARKEAARLFGEDFARSFIFKSVHDLVKLVAKADTKDLRKEDMRGRYKAASKLTNIWRQYLPDFLKRMLDLVVEELDKDAFLDGFDDEKKSMKDIQDLPTDDCGKVCGKAIGVLNSVKEKSKGKGLGVDFKDSVQMIDNLKNKFERLQLAFGVEPDLESCSSAGIMLLSALSVAGKDVWENEEKTREWIAHKFQVSGLKEEIECDLRPSVSVVENHAMIQVGEIKTHVSDRAKALAQMVCQASLLEFGLINIVSSISFITKRGDFFYLEGKTEQTDQNGIHEGLTIFVHECR